MHHLGRCLQKFWAIGVVMMGSRCPNVQQCLDRLKQIQSEFYYQGVTLVGINANDESQFPEDSFNVMKSFVIEHELNFPYLRDITQDVAQGFGANQTPEVFLIDQEGLSRYVGAIDDGSQQPSQPVNKVTVHYLRDAIQQLLWGENISPASTTAVGSPIQWRSDGSSRMA